VGEVMKFTHGEGPVLPITAPVSIRGSAEHLADGDFFDRVCGRD
jgi:hypothetical protein